MTLKCPPGTTVSVALAHYGRASESGTQNCGIPSSSSSSSSIKHSSKHSSKFSSNFAIDQNQQNNDQNQQNNDQNQQNNDTCLLPSSLQKKTNKQITKQVDHFIFGEINVWNNRVRSIVRLGILSKSLTDRVGYRILTSGGVLGGVVKGCDREERDGQVTH
ncbi:hypothetical protein M0804_010124 [Polistes exclamans]|nr:hypothetical protein M0804_010124 [Polistes exclamans]